jgi:hypothetical protein
MEENKKTNEPSSNEQNVENENQQQVVTEDNLIDFIFFTLFTNLSKNEMHLENEILSPSQLELDTAQVEHIRELLMATGFIKASVGFGKNGFIYLTGNGIHLMKVYKSYSAYAATLHNNNNADFNENNSNNDAAAKPINNAEPPHYLEDDMAS